MCVTRNDSISMHSYVSLATTPNYFEPILTRTATHGGIADPWKIYACCVHVISGADECVAMRRAHGVYGFSLDMWRVTESSWRSVGILRVQEIVVNGIRYSSVPSFRNMYTCRGCRQ